MPAVVVERLPEGRYRDECVALAKDYATPAWESRPETAAIRSAVFSALDRLDAESGITARFAGRPVLVKPNLVIVFNGLGTLRPASPESTDPRLLDAVVVWLAERGRAASITIVESSGRGFPTRASFLSAGIDRLARRRGCALLALEEQPVDRYILPKAAVQREILVPRVFSPVVRGEAAYVSVPKLKTNLYTGVTLGFKNAMGVIPYNLRQRHHHFAIERKLVEMLFLFRPSLTVIDGVVGGEGECPAPVDPVDSRLIVAGDQVVETDRAAAKLMGFDPEAIRLLQVADELGFGDPGGTRVLGDLSPAPFRPADRSLLSDQVRREFPHLRFLFGVTRPGADPAAGPDMARLLEAACLGGCVASVRFGLAMLKEEGVEADRARGTVIIGQGLPRDGIPVWYDREGRAYDEAAIRNLPGKKAVIGSCGAGLAGAADYHAAGCMPLANAPHAVLHSLTGTACRVLSLKNKSLPAVLAATLRSRRIRRRWIGRGERLDVDFPAGPGPVETRPLSEKEKEADWIAWPQPPVTSRREKKALRDFEDDAVFGSLRGVLVRRIKDRIWWRTQAAAGLALTLTPLILAGLGAAGIRAGWGASTWLAVFGAVEAVHLVELPLALRAHARRDDRLGLAPSRRSWRRILAILTIGYPAWLPYARGVFD